MPDDKSQQKYWEGEHGHRGYNHPVVKYFGQQRIDFISQFLPDKQIRSALDVGCGNGFSTYYFSQLIPNIYGLDRSLYMLKRHPLKEANKVCLGDGFKLPFSNNQFDLVYGWEILHHVSDPSVVVCEMARVSCKMVIIFEPNPLNPVQFLFALIDPEHHWVLRYKHAYMMDLFKKAGLVTCEVGSGGWIFPNKTPAWLLESLKMIPYSGRFGISNYIVAIKPEE